MRQKIQRELTRGDDPGSSNAPWRAQPEAAAAQSCMRRFTEFLNNLEEVILPP